MYGVFYNLDYKSINIIISNICQCYIRIRREKVL